MPKRVRPPESFVTTPLKCGSSLRSTKTRASSKFAMALCSTRLSSQLLLDGIKAALHLLEPLIEHAITHLLLLSRHNIAIEALLQPALNAFHIGHARRERGEVRNPSAKKHAHHN